MSAQDEREWNISNSLRDMQVHVGKTPIHISVDAGKYESYSCHVNAYLVETVVAPAIGLREMVRRNAGDVVADEVAQEVCLRLNALVSSEAIRHS